jgi:putative peptidoglycan lipid II flippase
VLLLMAPGTLGLAAVQLNVFVNTVLATGEGTGAVSWLNYAFRIMYLPIGLFGASIGTAALPDIARHAAMDDLAGLRRTVAGALRLMLMLNIPATVGLVLLAQPIVSMLLERGRFGPADTAATAAALMCYAPGLIGYSAVKIASPTFYSLRDSRTPVIVSVLSVLANLTMNLALVRIMGFRGLALGTALAAMFNAVALFWLLGRRLGGLEGRRIATSLLKIVIASIVMGLAAWSTSAWLTRAIPGDALLWKAVRVTAAIGSGVIVLIVSARLLRIAEFEEALKRVLRRFKPSS